MEPDYIFEVLISSGFRTVRGLYNLHLSDWMLGFKFLTGFTISVIRGGGKKKNNKKIWSLLNGAIFAWRCMVKWSCNVSLLYLRRLILLILLDKFAIDYWSKANQENLFLSFLWVQSSPDFRGNFSCRKNTHQIHAEVKTWAEHTILPSTACHNYKVHMQQWLQVLLPHKFAFAYKHFWNQKTGRVPQTNKPHYRLRETFTRIPIWDSCWDTIPMDHVHPSNLSITTEAEFCLSVLGVFWNDKLIEDKKMQQHPALKIFTKTKTHLENFSGFLITPFHVAKETIIKCNNKKQTSNPTTKGQS